MTTQADYRAAIDHLVGGDLPLGADEQNLAIAMAVKLYSKHSPKIVVEDMAGTGGFDYALSGLASFDPDFSCIKNVEFPVDDDSRNGNVLQDDAWEIYEKPSGSVLRFLEDTPAADENMRISYSAYHTCTVSACSVASFDHEAVQALAAGYFAQMLATYFAQSNDSTISADSVDHSSKSREYAARAKMLKTMYYDHIGIKPGSVKPASVTGDKDFNGSWGRDRMTHPRKYR